MSLELMLIFKKHSSTCHHIRRLELRPNSGKLIHGMMKELHLLLITGKFGVKITLWLMTSS
jgi:hypothetical protein